MSNQNVFHLAQPRPSCCYRAGRYLSYAASTSGRRLLTMADVVTDLRTFYLLWYDPNTTIVACFLLACLSTPFLVYWASAHNWAEAIIAHKTFGTERPRNCRERCHRRFYNMVGVPLLGVYLTSVQIIMWWTLDIIMGLFCQRRHKQELERLEQRQFYKQNRSMPLLMPPESAKYLTVVELFYESIPQSILQTFVFLTHPSPYFKLQDVMISVGASLANTVLNCMDILAAARTRRMYFMDYLLYFMSGQISDMLESAVPLRRFLRNEDVQECDLTGFKTLYTNNDAMKNITTVVHETPISGSKRIILPFFPNVEIEWSGKRYRRAVSMILAFRKNKSLHATLPDKMVPERTRYILSKEFREEALRSSAARRRHCDVRAARCLNHWCGCCGTHPGDVLCATNTHVLDDDVASRQRRQRNRRSGCLRRAIVARRDSLPDEMVRFRCFFLQTFLKSPLTSPSMRGVVAYLVVGDLPLVYHMVRYIMDDGVTDVSHVSEEQTTWFLEQISAFYDGLVPERHVCFDHARYHQSP